MCVVPARQRVFSCKVNRPSGCCSRSQRPALPGRRVVANFRRCQFWCRREPAPRNAAESRRFLRSLALRVHPCECTHIRMEGGMAERVGFEPTVPLRVHLISSQGRSTGLRHLSARSRNLAALSGSGNLQARCESGPASRGAGSAGRGGLAELRAAQRAQVLGSRTQCPLPARVLGCLPPDSSGGETAWPVTT